MNEDELRQKKNLAQFHMVRLNPIIRKLEGKLEEYKDEWEGWWRIYDTMDRRLAHIDGRRVKVTHQPYQPEARNVPLDQMGADELEALVS